MNNYSFIFSDGWVLTLTTEYSGSLYFGIYENDGFLTSINTGKVNIPASSDFRFVLCNFPISENKTFSEIETYKNGNFSITMPLSFLISDPSSVYSSQKNYKDTDGSSLTFSFNYVSNFEASLASSDPVISSEPVVSSDPVSSLETVNSSLIYERLDSLDNSVSVLNISLVFILIIFVLRGVFKWR